MTQENETYYTKDVGFAVFCTNIEKRKYLKKVEGKYYFAGSPEEFKALKVNYINSPYKSFNSTIVLFLRS